MKVLIDADPIVYEVGFAGEERWYELRWWPNGEETYAWFYSKWRADKFIELLAIDTDEYELSLERESEPLPFVLSTVKRKLKNIFQAVDGFLAESGKSVDEFQLYLTDGKSNFRNQVATIVGYKANRDPTHKPIYYTEIREYMIEHWDARIVRGAEADDAVSIAQHQAGDLYDTCICTIDKDLKMVPGFHYNYRTKKEFFIDEDEAIVNFYRQLLTGDPTDNIKGCFRIGPAKAERMIDTVLEDNRHGQQLAIALYAVTLDAYEASVEKYGEKTGYADMGAEAALLENARLLWMQEYPGQLWTPPNQPDELIEVFKDN